MDGSRPSPVSRRNRVSSSFGRRALDALGQKPRHLYRSNETVFTIIQQWSNVGNDRGRGRRWAESQWPTATRPRLARKPRAVGGEKPGHGEGLLSSPPLSSLPGFGSRILIRNFTSRARAPRSRSKENGRGKREKKNNAASAPRLIGNEITCFFEIARSYPPSQRGNVGRDCPPSLFETFYIQECRSNSRVNFDNDGQKEGLEGTKERILIESRYANQRTSVLSTASGLYHFMLWIPRAAPLHRVLAPVSRGD